MNTTNNKFEHGEPVVSEHRLYSQINDRSLKCYTQIEFRENSIVAGEETVIGLLNQLMTLAHEDSIRRSKSAYNRAFRNENPKDNDMASILTEVFFDSYFRKGNREYIDRNIIRSKILSFIKSNKPIQLVFPLFPNKVICPLKSRGIHTDFGEVLLLIKLLELRNTIKNIYDKGIDFFILADGHRFQNSWNTPEENIELYQKEIIQWINILELDFIHVVDYESLVAGLPIDFQKKRFKQYKESIDIYTKLVKDFFNPDKFEESLINIIKNEPFPDLKHPEGRFVPLLKSTMTSINYPDDFFDQNNLVNDYSAFIQSVFAKKSYKIGQSKYEQCQRIILNSTIEYLSEVQKDRFISDPVQQCFPNALRATIHPKPNQIGLITISRQDYSIQPWHGVGYIRNSKDGKQKGGVETTLFLEGKHYKPVFVRDTSIIPNVYLNQPFLYLEDGININSLNLIRSR